MIVFVASLCVSFIASAQADNGLPALEEDLDNEIAARIAGDEDLQGQINTIELTPGPQGDQGIQGDKGDKGDQGDQGIQGIQGVKGDKGDKGDTGLTGDKGDTGDKGLTGADSTVAGPQGDKGDTGADSTVAGPQGPKGDPGADGADGDTPWTDNVTNLSTGVSIQFGDEDVTCNSATAGTIRWTGTDFEGCDGRGWVSLTETSYGIGDTGPAGGIVFYTKDGGLHGLEAAPSDQDGGFGAEWGCYGIEIDGAGETAVGTGAQNTTDILAGCSETGTAADLADAYTLNGYDDWFLPSKEEMNELFIYIWYVAGEMTNFSYWTSTQYDSTNAWVQYWGDGWQFEFEKDRILQVRAVRAF